MPRFDSSHSDIAHLFWVQDGVVSRRQLLGMGATDNDIRRLVRRRELHRVHPGVFVNHTGPLTPAQRQWVAVLAAWPAALTRESALPVPQHGTIHLAVAPRRKLRLPARVVVHPTGRLAERADLAAHPPRMHLDHALIDAMSSRLAAGDVPGAFTILAEVAHSRRTTPNRVLDALASRQRVAHRATIAALITDLRDGACSVLERGYLHRVERAHGLPRPSRQHTSFATGRQTDQDVRYDAYGVIVELDGRAFHDTPSGWDDDARRDLAELAPSEAVTARVTYGLVFRDACRTASWIGHLLRRRGWTGQVQPCDSCRIRQGPGFQSLGD